MPKSVCSKSRRRKSLGEWDEVLRLIPGYDPFRDSDGFYFDPVEAQWRIDFVQSLTHVKGELAGKPIQLMPWQKAITANLFGWKEEDTGLRRYREMLFYVPRKNGKTTIIAAYGASVFLQDDERGMECYSAAAEAEQASLTWSIGKSMILSDDEFRKHVNPYARSITKKEDPVAFWKYLTKDARSKHGFNIHFAAIDELHVCDQDLIDVIISATGSRRQPLIMYMTTADYERPSVCNRTHDYATRVRDGIFTNPRFLPVIYEAHRDDDWKNPAVWRQSNPCMGVSKSVSIMESECQRGIDDPGYENVFKRLHLNIRTEQATRAIQMDKWDVCGVKTIDPESFRGRTGWGGLDLGQTSDLTALAIRFPNSDGSYDGLFWFWVPEEKAHERERRDRVPYLAWAKQGYIRLTEGNETDYSVVRADMNEIGKKYRIAELAVDRLFQGAETCQNLIADGFNVAAWGQGFASMTGPTLEYIRQVNRGAMHHGGNPVMRWMASNLMLRIDSAGNAKPDKEKSGNKIDGIVADIQAFGIAMKRDKNAGKSVYDQRGVHRF